MTIEEYIKEQRERVNNMTLAQARQIVADHYGHDDMRIECEKAVWMLLDCADEKINGGWIPIKTRKLTDAEEEDMFENSNYYYNYMFDCLLPEDGEKVLVTTSTGEVTDTTFYDEGIDGCYFEFYEDEGDVIAWMPKPKPYKAESEVEDGNVD